MINLGAGMTCDVTGNTADGDVAAANFNGDQGGTFRIWANTFLARSSRGESDQFIVRINDWEDAGSYFVGNVLDGRNLKTSGLQVRKEATATNSRGTIAFNTITGAATNSLNIVYAPTFTITNNIFHSTAAAYAIYERSANWPAVGMTLNRNCYYGGQYSYAPGGVITTLATLIVPDDADAYLAGRAPAFDVVFVDPPFRQNAVPDVLAKLPPRLRPGARVYVESGAPVDAPPPWTELKRRRAGGELPTLAMGRP